MRVGAHLEIPVNLSVSGPGFVAGTHYRADDGATTLQVCIHGNTYDQRYWDAGTVNGHDYSYARYMVARGHDVLTLDLPGVGRSSPMDGDLVDLDAGSRELARVVEHCRSELGTPYDRVVLVGHSLGAVVAMHVQSHFHVADALIVTGCSGLAMVRPSFRKDTISDALTEPHLRLPANVRGKVFYHRPTADPKMIRFDNQVLATSMPRRLYKDCVAARLEPDVLRVADVKGAVYVQLGDRDPIANASGAHAERCAWSSAEQITVEGLQDIGHCFNLHLNRESSWRGIDAFLESGGARSESAPGKT